MARTGIQRSQATGPWAESSADASSTLEVVQPFTSEDRDTRGAADRVLMPIIEDVLIATHAGGAALALEANGTVICCARAGESAPSLGAELDRQAGISGLCLRTGETVRCHDAASDPRVEREAARNLGVCSILAIPLTFDGATVGLLEVFSPSPYAFGVPEEAAAQQAVQRVLAVLSGNEGTEQAAGLAQLPVEEVVVGPELPLSAEARDEKESEVAYDEASARQQRAGRHLMMLLGALAVVASIAIGISLRTGQLQLKTQNMQPAVELNTQPLIEQSQTETPVQWLLRAAGQGEASAQYELAMRYRQGDGVAQDDNAAARWLQEAARQGHGDAQYELGNVYSEGWGVPRDPILAYACYVLAAANGNAASEEALKFLTPKLSNAQIAQVRSTIAEMYVQGRGTPIDYVAAYTWFTLAEAAGSADSQRARESLASKMTNAQIATANRRSSEWLKRHPQVKR